MNLAALNGSLLCTIQPFCTFSFVPLGLFSCSITAEHGLQTRTFAAKHNEQCSHFNGFTLEITFLIKSPLLGSSCNCTARVFMFGYNVSSCCDRTSQTIMALSESCSIFVLFPLPYCLQKSRFLFWVHLGVRGS